MKKITVIIAAIIFASCTKQKGIMPMQTSTVDTPVVPEMIICFPGGSGDTTIVDTTVIYPTR